VESKGTMGNVVQRRGGGEQPAVLSVFSNSPLLKQVDVLRQSLTARTLEHFSLSLLAG
jgi:hypothetical protein